MIAVTEWRDIGIQALERSVARILVLPTGRDRERPDRGAGVIGSDAILKQRSEAGGTASAASLRPAGAVGPAAGCQLCDTAIVISVATVRTLRFAHRPGTGPGKGIRTGACRSPP